MNAILHKEAEVKKIFTEILHGGDYNPDQWLDQPAVIEEDFRLIKLAGCNTFSIGIFAWTSYEREEGIYDFTWLEAILDRMAKEGHKVFLATPTGSRPAWMAQKYPEVRKIARNGLRQPSGRRRNHCWTSPVYREKVRLINGELAKRFGNHEAVAAWHISNEYGGDSEPACYCDHCLGAFHQWLENRYKSLDAMNKAYWAAFWSHTYTAWEQVDPRDTSVDGLALDWKRFQTWQIGDYYNWEKAALREFSKDIPCTTNFMGLLPSIDFGKLSEAVDFVSDDQYPAYNPAAANHEDTVCMVSFKNDLYRCFKPDTPWMLMESCPDSPQWKHPMKLKRPGLHQAEMLQAIGHGADGTCYFQWRKGRGSSEKFHGAVVDHAGHEHTRVFQTVSELSKLYEKLGPVVGSKTQSDIAVIYDWEVMWALEATGGPDIKHEDYLKTVLSYYRPFHENGYPVDVISSEADISRYKIVVAPLLFMLKPGVAEKLIQFVTNGGTLVSGYWSGIVNESNLCFTGGWPGNGLRDLFGIWNEETDCLGKAETKAIHIDDPRHEGLHMKISSSRACAIVHAESATVLAHYAEDFYSGTPALTEKRHGTGRAIYMATQFEPAFLNRFLLDLAHEANINLSIRGKLPDGVRLQERSKGNERFLFVENFSLNFQYLNISGNRMVSMMSGEVEEAEIALPPLSSSVWKFS
jgi:beta-galactosidase